MDGCFPPVASCQNTLGKTLPSRDLEDKPGCRSINMDSPTDLRSRLLERAWVSPEYETDNPKTIFSPISRRSTISLAPSAQYLLSRSLESIGVSCASTKSSPSSSVSNDSTPDVAPLTQRPARVTTLRVHKRETWSACASLESKINSVVEDLTSRFVAGRETSEDVLKLETFLGTHVIPIDSLSYPLTQLCTSQHSPVRAVGYRLIAKLCTTNRPLSPIDVDCLWTLLCPLLEKEEQVRSSQLKAIELLMGECDVLPVRARIFNRLTCWSVDKAGSTSIPGSDCDYLINGVISDRRYSISEEQMAGFFNGICCSLSKLVESFSPTQEFFATLEKQVIRFLSFLSCAHDYDELPIIVLPHLVQTLCGALHCIKSKFALYGAQGTSAPRLENEMLTALCRLLDDPVHGHISFQTIMEILLPTTKPNSSELATGALFTLERCLLVTLSTPGDEPTDDAVIGCANRPFIAITEILPILEQVPRSWMNHGLGEEVLCALCLLVERISQGCPAAYAMEVASSVGKIVKALVPIIQSYRDAPGLVYTLSLHGESRAPSRIIYQLQRILVIKRDRIHIEPPLDEILLSLGHRLDDESLRQTILSLKQRGALDPSSIDWKRHFCTLLDLFVSRRGAIPLSRKDIASYMSQLYDTLAEVESPHTDVVDEIISAWEQTLPNEEDEGILMAASRVLSTEIILSFDKGTSTAGRIRHMWTDLALRENSPCFRRILAVKFLIKAFNNFAFHPPQAFRVFPNAGEPPHSHFAANIAISLYRDLISLAGMSRDAGGRVTSPRVNCPQARLVLLQWLLRLRSGARHRIHTSPGILPEIIPLAKLICRSKEEEKCTCNSLVAGRGSYSEAPKDRRTKRVVLQPPQPNPIRRLFARPIPPVTPREKGSDEAGRRSPPCPDPLQPPSSTDLLWSLPEDIHSELFEGTAIPMPMTGISTYAAYKDEKQGHWLPVSEYLMAINDILEFDTDWEVVSYILCLLPLQLANQHFFCGPKVDPEIQRLARVMCSALDRSSLYKRMKLVKPSKANEGGITAVIYSTLTVLVSYRRRFAQEGAPSAVANAIKERIVECFVEGIGTDIRTSRPSFEALSMIVYAMPESIAKYTVAIVEKLSRIMSTRGMAIHIIEFLILLGLNRRLYTSSFRTEHYQRVYGAALIYIEEHYRKDVATFRTSDGRESFSLAQHVLIAAYLVIQAWFMRMKLDDRARFIPFISSRLIRANGGKYPLRPTTTVCLDWLSRYTYGNVDPKVTPSYIYTSIICPQAPDGWRFSVRRSWRDKDLEESRNVESVKAWKLGNSIITASVLKEPEGWIRIVCRRPSCLVELVCHLEGQKSNPLPHPTGESDALKTQTSSDESFEQLISGIFTEPSNLSDLDKPDPVSGYTLSSGVPNVQKTNTSCDPSFIAPLLVSYPFHESRRLRKFPDYDALRRYLALIDGCPVLDTYNVAVLYVAPGQTSEAQILANRHGSPSYSQFISRLGRVIKPNDNLEVYTGGLQPELHGDYALAWWDDIGQILFHVATFMPNRDNNLHKKMEIGNDAVKIIWNDGGSPYNMDTFPTEFNLVNFVIEPHTQMPKAVYQGGWPWHANSFFKVLIQTHPSVPIVTPIGDFKIISAEHLPRLIRHYALLASLFCRSWLGTGRDEPPTQRLVTHWQQRLNHINQTERLFTNSDPSADLSDSYYVPN